MFNWRRRKMAEKPGFDWSYLTDMVPVFKKMGFTDEAIKEAKLIGKRLELHHTQPKMWFVRVSKGFETLATEDSGDDFVHTCPPECPG